MVYGVRDKPARLKEWVGYTLQFLFAVLPATILISSISGTSIDAGLVSAGLGTLVFLAITGFKVPVMTSNSGATVTAIVSAIALSKSVETNLVGVLIGGMTMMAIYGVASIIIRRVGMGWLMKLIPPIVSGTTIIVIGVTLMGFIPTYAMVGGEYSLMGVAVAVATMAVATVCAVKGKGMLKNLPFLFALMFGYIVSMVLTAAGVANLIDFNALKVENVFSIPDFAFFHFAFKNFDWATLPQILVMFGFVSLAAMTEHIGDLTTVSAVVGEDFLTKPGIDKTLMADGVSSFVGALTGAQMTTTYSEYTSTIAVSGCASVRVTATTAITLIALAFVTPFNVFISALPNCVFAGVSIAAYGMIAVSGVRSLINCKDIFASSKNQFVFAAMLSCGVSGIAINYGAFSLSGVALAMIVGMVMNAVIKEENPS